jgi:Predicted exporters of the RND superfamily
MILGGYEDTGNVLDAQALIVTWVVNNYAQGTEEEANAIDWENTFQAVLGVVQEEAAERGLRVSFNSEVSLEQELNKSTNTDAKIVVISYLIMFFYASMALGSVTVTWRSLLTNPSNALVQSKFTLGIVGIIIVLMSVSASVGLFSAAGVKVTLIIAEVIPFLVLAVGVDNIFLIVHEFERVNISHPDEEIDERVARAVSRIGPSIFLSALTETVAFALGVFVGMPAVKNFAAYAAGAVFINAILQITMFISVLALNQRRVQSLRADCIPCLTVRKQTRLAFPRKLRRTGWGEYLAGLYSSGLRSFPLGSSCESWGCYIFLGSFDCWSSLYPRGSSWVRSTDCASERLISDFIFQRPGFILWRGASGLLRDPECECNRAKSPTAAMWTVHHLPRIFTALYPRARV